MDKSNDDALILACNDARKMADLIRRFAHGNVGRYEWDDIMGIQFKNPILEDARRRCEFVLRESGTADAESINDNAKLRLLEIAAAIENQLCGGN
jgi:hypothetical protein